MGDLSEHFSQWEFECHCGCGANDVSPTLVIALEELRELAGNRKIHIISGRRCTRHNKAVKGKRASQHLLGTAADIVIERLSPDQMAVFAKQIPVFQKGGIGIYRHTPTGISEGFVHVDVREQVARWDDGVAKA